MKSLKLSKTSAYGNLGAIRDRHLHFCAAHLQTLLGPTGGNSGFHWPPKKTLPQICRKKWSGVQSFTGVALPLLEVYSISVELGPFFPGIKNCTVRVELVCTQGASSMDCPGSYLRKCNSPFRNIGRLSVKKQQLQLHFWAPSRGEMCTVSALPSPGCKDTTDTGIEENCAGNSWMEDERSMSSQKLKSDLVSILALIAQIILKFNQPRFLRHWFSSIWTQLE